MYKKLSLFIALVVFAGAANAGYYGPKGKRTIEISSSLVGDYLSGDYAIRNQDVDTAAKIFMQALKKDPENQLLLSSGYKSMLALGKVDEAVEVARRYLEHEEMSSELGILLATYEMKSGSFNKADIILDSIAAKKGANISSSVNSVIVPFLKVWTKVGRENYEGSLKYSENILGAGRIPSLFLYYQSALVADIAKDEIKADENYTKILGEDTVLPYHFVRSAGNFYERMGHIDRAKNVYERYTAQYPELSRFERRIEDLNGNKNIADEMVVENAVHGFGEVLKEAVRVLYSSGYYNESLMYLRLVLFLNDEDDEAKSLLAKYYENNEQFMQAIKVHKSIDKDSHFYLTSQVNIAEDLYSLGKKRAAIKQLARLDKDMPGSKVILLTMADLLRQDGEYLEAAEVYSQIINLAQHHKLKDWPVFFARGICYERAKKWNKAEKDLLKALELRPAQPEVLNYLGYSWVDRNENIDAAKKMVETAVKARPNDAQMIDSMGWVLYKINDFDAASRFLEKAAELTPYDAVINDHLGDVYWRQGRYNEARFQWRRALKYKNSEDVVENDLKEKLNNGLPEIEPLEG